MKKKKIRLHPALVFLILTIGIMIISSIGSILNLETSYYVVNEATGDLNSQVVNINNLFNRTGLQYLISNMLNNFFIRNQSFQSLNLYRFFLSDQNQHPHLTLKHHPQWHYHSQRIQAD